jgi:hypothetical protein
MKGSFTPQYTWASLEGTQEGLCFSTCDVSGATYDVSRGTIALDKSKSLFTYDTSGRVGVSLRLWRVRLTTSGGVRYDTSWVRPAELGEGQGTTIRNGGTLGYFGSASLTFTLN